MIGIVVVNYNTYQDTINCVESVRSTYEGDYRIFIVDNCSMNDSFNILSNFFCSAQDVKVVQSDKNGGFSYGNNVGFRMAIQAGCDLILCTNSDVIFKNSAIKQMESSIYEDAKCGVVGPKVYCEDGQLQDIIFGDLTTSVFLLIRKPFRLFDIHKKVKKYFYSDYDYSYRLKPEGMVSGCCFMIRSKLIEEIGYFDENVFLYHEENIIGKKIKTYGYYVLLEPASEVIHLGGRSTGNVSAFTRYHKAISGLYYLWVYTSATERQLKRIFRILYIMFFVRGFFNKQYMNYAKQLKKNFRTIIKQEKYVNDMQ